MCIIKKYGPDHVREVYENIVSDVDIVTDVDILVSTSIRPIYQHR